LPEVEIVVAWPAVTVAGARKLMLCAKHRLPRHADRVIRSVTRLQLRVGL